MFVGLSGPPLGNGSSHIAQTWWSVGAWSNLNFLNIFFQVVTKGVCCPSSFAFFSDVLGCTRLKLCGWMELGHFVFLSNLISYDRSFLNRFLFSFFFFFFGLTSSHTAHTRCVGGAWSNLDFWSTFLVSRSSLHKFLWFFQLC